MFREGRFAKFVFFWITSKPMIDFRAECIYNMRMFNSSAVIFALIIEIETANTSQKSAIVKIWPA